MRPLCWSVCAHELPQCEWGKEPGVGGMGPNDGFRDVPMAPEPFLHLQPGVVTWTHHGDWTHVQDPRLVLGMVRQVCAGDGHAAVAASKILLLVSVSPLCLHVQPAGCVAFFVFLVPVLSALELELGVSHLSAGPREAEEARTSAHSSNTALRIGPLSTQLGWGGKGRIFIFLSLKSQLWR